ncbi:Hypothetical predicted protein [Lecanosticta acicola]|uniref:Uncharacterized protein n=1 Tax=Lecanosticta acicola TaxID=111012 RepID=A0AAI8Z103_9PEZI|nr:Hypothetical predicted protein [Lecanosticta acicola]
MFPESNFGFNVAVVTSFQFATVKLRYFLALTRAFLERVPKGRQPGANSISLTALPLRLERNVLVFFNPSSLPSRYCFYCRPDTMPLDDAPRSTASRMLRGLNPYRDIIDDGAWQETIEVAEEEAETRAQTLKHSTRSSRRGQAEVIYDMKYHPMDQVTRPNARATQRHRSKSISFADIEDTSSKTEDDSAPSSVADSEEEDSQDGSSDSEIQLISSPPRKQDPRAVRHSARGEAQKYVNYSKKHHPQDVDIPGFQHKTMYAAAVESTRSTSKPTPASVKRASPNEDEDGLEDTSARGGPPRKKLSSVDMSTMTKFKSKTKSKKKAKSKSPPARSKAKAKAMNKPKGASKKGNSRNEHDVDALVDAAIAGSQAPGPKKPTENDSDHANEPQSEEKSKDSSDDLDALVNAASPGSQASTGFPSLVEIGDSEEESSDIEGEPFAPAPMSPPPKLPLFESDDGQQIDRVEDWSAVPAPDMVDPDALKHSSHTLGHSDADYQAMYDATQETKTAMMIQDEDTQLMAATLEDACSPSSDTENDKAESHVKSINRSATPDFSAAVPEFIKNRHALEGGSAPLTQEKAMSMILKDYCNRDDVSLEIIKPYLQHEALQSRAEAAFHSPESQAAVDGEVEEGGKKSPFIFMYADGAEEALMNPLELHSGLKDAGGADESASEPASEQFDHREPEEEGRGASVSLGHSGSFDGQERGPPSSSPREMSLSGSDDPPSGHTNGPSRDESLPSPEPVLDDAVEARRVQAEGFMQALHESEFSLAMGDEEDDGTDLIDTFSEM